MRRDTGWVTVAWCVLACKALAANGSSATDHCGALAALKLDHVAIASATLQSPNAPVANSKLPQMAAGMPPGTDQSGLPAFCRVMASAHPEPGSDIRFEVWMPAEGWDGRMNGGNSGGFAGYINYMDLAGAVRAGQAGVATDTGHTGTPTTGDWALGHPERVRDYGWRGVHLSTVAGKQLVTAFYGRAPSHSYFIGCSNGGRQALMEAARFPDDYDGIVAGAPAAVWTEVAMSMINTVQAQSPPGAKLRGSQMKLLQTEVLKQCDALDGQSDGVIADPRMCHADISRLACGTNSSPECFTPPQLAALRRIVDGAHDSRGRPVGFGYPLSGAESGNPISFFGWEGWITGTATEPASHTQYPAEVLGKFTAHPFATVASFDFDKHPAQMRARFAADLDVSPDMRRFFARGGKLIIWHGTADAAISPLQTIAFHQAIVRNSRHAATDALRLFLVPGVQHCGGGTGAGSLGQMAAPMPGDAPERSVGAAVQSWVEQGRVPDRIVGREGLPISFGGGAAPNAKEHLLCAFPARTVLTAGADPDKGASYTCRAP